MNKVKVAIKYVGFLAIIFIGLAWWLADRPSDIATPPAVSGFVFDPQFGPKTSEAAQKYVARRIQESWRGHFNRDMKPNDADSDAAKQIQMEAINTLKDRWGITLDMTQEQIDAAYEERRLVWEYIQQSKTLRHQIRDLLGLAK